MSISLDISERVVLVDEGDSQIGIGAKLETHQSGALHRAFSIFLFDAAGRTLVQKRALHKYHSGGKWANTCCGHPRPDEPINTAARRRLGEELNMRTSLTMGFVARYRAELDGQMIENEIVHVFHGRAQAPARPNPDEASDVQFVDLEDLRDGRTIPVAQQTAWLRHYLLHHFDELQAVARGPRS
ncbi:MAG: isopentenyl-diphosphate Delta-isomerase [Pseudomonadota bacterium]